MALMGNQNISFGLSFEERKTDKEGRREEREKKKKGREEEEEEEKEKKKSSKKIKGMESNIEYGLLGFLIWIHVCVLWVVRNLTLE